MMTLYHGESQVKAPRTESRKQTNDDPTETTGLRYGGKENWIKEERVKPRHRQASLPRDGMDKNGNTAEIAEITADYLQRYRKFKQIERRRCKYSVLARTREVRNSKENTPVGGGGRDKDRPSYPEVRPLLDLINQQQTQGNGHTAIHNIVATETKHVENGGMNKRIITNTQPHQEMQMPEQAETEVGNSEFPLVKLVAEWTEKEKKMRTAPYTMNGRHQGNKKWCLAGAQCTD